MLNFSLILCRSDIFFSSSLCCTSVWKVCFIFELLTSSIVGKLFVDLSNVDLIAEDSYIVMLSLKEKMEFSFLGSERGNVLEEVRS